MPEEQQQAQQMTAAERLEEKFAIQRREYTNEIMTGNQMLKDIRKLIDAKVLFLSLRQRLIESKHTIVTNYDKQARRYREVKSEELLRATDNLQVRFNEREKDKYVEGIPRVSQVKSTMDFLQSQSDYLEDSVKTVDHALYGIKEVIEIQKFLRGE